MQRDDKTPRVDGQPWIRFVGDRVEVTLRVPVGADGRDWCWTLREAMRSVAHDLDGTWPAWGGASDWDDGWAPVTTWERDGSHWVVHVWGKRTWSGWDWKRAAEALWNSWQNHCSEWGWAWWMDTETQQSWWNQLEETLSEGWWWMTPGAADVTASSPH